MPDEYLSTDPNAGQPLSLDEYLSTDPNAGAAPKGKSVSGFISNVGGSAGRVVSGTLSMLDPSNWGGIVKNMAEGQTEAWRRMEAGEPQNAPLAQRYGSVEKAANTLYTDPVGAALELVPGAKPVARFPGVMKNAVQATGKRLVTGALKTPTSLINKIPGAESGGLATTARRIAQDTLDENVNLFREAGRDTVQSGIDTAAAQRTGAVHAAPQVPVPGSGGAQLQALRPVARKYGPASQPLSEADTAGIAGIRGELRRNTAITRPTSTQVPVDAHLADDPFLTGGDPSLLGNTAYGVPTQTAQGPRRMRDLTPDELLTQHEGSNRALFGMFGKSRNAEIEAQRAIGQSTNTSLEQAVPGTKALGQRMNKLITLRNVGEAARKRGEGRDGFGINDIIALSSGHLAPVVASSAMRPMVQNAIGKGVYNLGNRSVNLQALYRAALLAQLAEGGGEP